MVHFRYDFRGHIRGSATKGVYSLFFSTSETEPEINELDLLMPVNKNILSLNVSVDDIKTVQILQGLSNDEHKFLGLCFVHFVLRLREQVVIERISASILQDEVNFRLGLNSLDKLSNGRMVELCKQVDLSLQVLNLIGLIDFLLLVYLDGNLLSAFLLDAHSDNAVCAFAQLAEYLVLAELLFPLNLDVEIEN